MIFPKSIKWDFSALSDLKAQWHCYVTCAKITGSENRNTFAV